MSASMREASARPESDASSAGAWCLRGPGIEVKILSADTARHAVEYLVRLPPGFHIGPCRHHAETLVYILAGQLCGATDAAQFSSGDLCCQPRGVLHEEVAGPQGATVYVSQRGTQDLLVEFLADDGSVRTEFRVSDFARLCGPPTGD